MGAPRPPVGGGQARQEAEPASHGRPSPLRGRDLGAAHRRPVERLPCEFGPKSTVHDRFQEWVRAGAFARAWTLLLEEYDEFVGLDLHWQSADGCLVKAPLGKKGGPEKLNARAATPPIGAHAARSAIC